MFSNKNGKILLAGEDGTNPYSPEAWVASINLNGSMNWERSYKYFGSAGHHQIKSVVRALDGGVLIGGASPPQGGTVSQDIWLLKVDSVGCLVPNCNLGIDEREFEESLLTVYPVPFTNQLSFEYLGSLVGTEYKVHDIMGKLILWGQVNRSPLQLDTSTLPNGTFVITLWNKGKLMERKVVVKE